MLPNIVTKFQVFCRNCYSILLCFLLKIARCSNNLPFKFSILDAISFRKLGMGMVLPDFDGKMIIFSLFFFYITIIFARV